MFLKPTFPIGNPVVNPLGPINSAHPKILVSAILISFIGSLPLGTLNVVIVQLSIASGYAVAFWFAAGSLLAELFYVRISLVMMDRIVKFQVLLKMLQWISLIILIALAIAAFMAAAREQTPAANILVSNTLHPFFFGFLLMASNPVQIPFWLGWSTVLFERKILMPKAMQYALYMAGAGLGSLMGSVLFVFGGQALFTWVAPSQKTFHWVIGAVFMLTALLQMRKMLHRDRVSE